MKKTGKIFSVVLALVFVFAMAIPAFAANDGKITITNAVKDQSYTIYQMLNFTPIEGSADKGIYTIVAGWENFFATEPASTVFDVSDNKVTLETGKTITPELARAAVDYAKQNKISGTTKTAEGTSVEFTGLPLGYFAVDTSLGAICSLTNTNSTATTIEKNQGPTIVKKILEDNNLVDANNVRIGDTVTYQVTIHIGKGLTNYVMHDTMTHLTFTGVTNVKVFGGDADVAEGENTYTVKTGDALKDGHTFDIEFAEAFVEANANKDIIVTYEATLDADAVVGNTGNPNTVVLEYKNEDTVVSTPEDTVITYTTKIVVNKVNGENTPLKGAGFTLYDANGNKIGEELKGTDMTTFVWTGLKEGTYKIVETTVPAGYNKADDITVVIKCTEPDTVSAETDTATWTEGTDPNVTTLGEGYYETTVTNTTGALLPETGGIGTTIFYIVGGLFVVGAAIILITRKRTSVEA